ncbi:TIM barrel protein [Streptomyces sp. HB2AG]|uniref:TIM barrel protein n=1 Tax=Streptomyces sp. HB2AG TaxID=2983400 RepID=UPI0022AB30BC|nr:TIM barrel protein [Streptomyces sp. HB2AG]MCZ2525599.1 TIM barrel protein [Streptomyces sp. HB2AG]
MSPSTARGIGSRTAAAPISWGVCEVPGWGHQLPAPRVLSEMASLGLTATEFGPDGFLPACPDERTAVLAGHGLAPVGGFVPVVLHDAERDPLAGIAGVLEEFARSGAGTLVVAAATGLHGYDARPVLGGDGWRTLLDNLERIAAAASRRGMTAVLHPHVGTMVESAPEVDRVLEGSGIGLCLDTGHLLAGGADPVALARRAGRRVAHVHLKDVDAAAAAAVRSGRTGYAEAVAAGMYRPLGDGDVDVPAIVEALEGDGYDGWYVLEQDCVLAGEPAPGEGPVRDVRASVSYLLGL